MTSKEMSLLLRRLAEIDVACSPERKQKEQEEAAKKLDEFAKEKKDLAEKIRQVRQNLDERDTLHGNGDRGGAAKLSSKIRSQLKEIEDEGRKLEKLQKEKHSKLRAKQMIPGVSVPKEKVQKDESRKAVVDLMWKHMKELQWRQENPGSRPGDDKHLMESASDESGERKVVVGGIPDIDDPQFELLRKQDDQIDAELDIVLAGVKRLKALAQQAGEELDQQAPMVEELNEMAEDAVANLETVNMELKKTLKSMRNGRDLCCDLIIFAIILGIATAVYFLISG